MQIETIEQRLSDIRLEIYSLESIDDVLSETRILELRKEKDNLEQLLNSCFDEIIGL